MSTTRTQGISLITATAVVVANMIGTGVFTSLGFQVGSLPSGFVLLMLWVVGGVCAFCGAVCYGELAAALPRSGGEYNFLSEIFHPAVGFLSGWLSITVGFAAPIALAAMAFGEYFSGIFPNAPATTWSLVMVWIVTLIHVAGVNAAARFQNTATWLKVALIVVFIGTGFWFGRPQPVHFLPQPGDVSLLGSTPFAVSLVFVMYAYAGWNAATYIVGDIRNPQKNVPLAIAFGTLLVAGLYIALNAVFLHVAPMNELDGKVDVGHVAAVHIFGETGGRIMSGLICLGLVSSISAMTWVGPRVMRTMGQDLRILSPLAVCDDRGVPVTGLFVQLSIVVTLLLTASFKTVLTCVQFSIQLGSFATVIGLIVLRIRQPDLPRPYRCWGYPVTPILFLAISLWMMVFVAKKNPDETLAGMALILLGWIVYFISPRTPRTT
ncbi:APC family permease [Prosthecobacter sp.]|uniref:APC family permease n=1 Tax=Prosthecobacter sp. TaxID=1965333 RepID=UPI0037847227